MKKLEIINSLDVILQNECKLALEGMGYIFENDTHVCKCPKDLPVLFATATTELKKSKESDYKLAPHIVYYELDYVEMYNKVKILTTYE